ncbi:MAG: PSD1 domain-containing protein [Planctomycetaceae bacterium]|nr:PSD1 domain-containing protein [Planctomycetaceae bacterium]
MIALRRSTVVGVSFIAFLVMILPAALLPAGESSPDVDFGRDIVPLLKDKCFRCHQGRAAEAGRRLDVKSELLGAQSERPLVVRGKSEESRLIEVVSGRDAKIVMPPEGPRLTDAEVSRLRRWIDGGLAWDRDLLPESDDPLQHWAFRPVERPAVPAASEGWCRNPIDRFLAARHVRRRLTPAPEATRRTLIRRMSLTLWGLPPSRNDVDDFAADERPEAVERLADRLLQSPRYGEHWARHWLDLARWAESEGFESNHPRASAWRYRDYVVESLNADKPFDAFLRQQIAGDELPDESDENLIATGFLAAARISSNEEDKWLQRNDVTVDVVNTVGSAFLGLTLHCAQCHDHKFDPLSARDYYALHAFFARGMPVNVRLRNAALNRDYAAKSSPELTPAVALKEAIFEAARRRMVASESDKLTDEERTAIDTPADQRSVPQELLARKASLRFQKTPNGVEKYIPEADRKLYEELKKKIVSLEQLSPPAPQTFAFYAPSTSPHRLDVLPSLGFYPLPFEPDDLARLRTYVMVRGDVHNIGPDVVPGWPEILSRADSPHELSSSPTKESSAPHRRTRRELADWMTDSRNPLVARVWVNRLWQHHFGSGLVATPDDFGIRGARPSHPELLDWLAAELIDHGWSTKHIQRLIVTSAAFRLGPADNGSTEARAVAAQRRALDPENRLVTRWVPRRLEAETLRDASLAVSGELDLTAGGPSVPLDQRETSHRRSLYLFQRRGQPPEMQRLFDGPNECSASTAVRTASTSPLQSLYLLNSPFLMERARTLAADVERLAESDRAGQIEAAFRRVLSRPPTAEERAAAETLWVRVTDGVSNTEAGPRGTVSPLQFLCQSLLNLNEFAFVE